MKLVLSRLVNINRFVLDRLIVRSSFLLHSVMRLNANCVRFEMILSNFPFKSHAYVIHPLAALMVAESLLGVSVMNQLFSVLTMTFTVISTTPLYLAVDANKIISNRVLSKSPRISIQCRPCFICVFVFPEFPTKNFCSKVPVNLSPSIMTLG